jgi:NAD(P)-dependent dehydrogenase (short-subunit alcohol dehydrogenase family)
LPAKGACLVIGAGDGVGAAVARAFAREGYSVCLTRRPRHAEKLQALADSIGSEGGAAHAFPMDARLEGDMVGLVDRIEADIAPLEVAVFNIGANVRFPVTGTTTQVYTKVWEMAALAGFLMGREAARVMTPRMLAVAHPTPPSPAPSTRCAPWPRAWHVSSDRRAFTSLMSSLTA